jgi:hypothetical protein
LQCGPAANSVEYVATPNGSCTPSPVSPTGSAPPAGPVTICCL